MNIKRQLFQDNLRKNINSNENVSNGKGKIWKK